MPLKYIDSLLDRITMYRLVLYYLIAILIVAIGLSLFGFLPYSAISILGSTAILIAVCAAVNRLFALIYDAPTNLESTYITALILVCILPPIHSLQDLSLLGWAAILATASKYILALYNKHFFNPVAVAVVLTAFWLNQSAIWWVGTSLMAPIIILGGILMVRKMRRYGLVIGFLLTVVITVTFASLIGGYSLYTSLHELLLRSPLFFFAFVMLTEPLTSPPTLWLQCIYGGIVGILFAPQTHIGSLYFTPELALVAGNVFSYAVSPKIKERLKLKATTSIANNVIGFDFLPAHPPSFNPGQYMEFTLPHPHADNRGNRRYFTIASSPTEKNIKLGVKFYENSSSFKQHARALAPEQAVMAGQLAGDFTLPKNKKEKLVFIAGGIGITPFRSMLKYLTDKNEQRDIVLIYMNKGPEDVAYQDVFEAAQTTIQTKMVYTFTATMPEGWAGRTGAVTSQMVSEEVPDFMERVFYISGPHPMVGGVEATLKKMGIKGKKIKKDFFPGLT